MVAPGERFITHILRKLLAGRDGAEAVGGNQDLHLRQHLEHHRYAHRKAETVVAQIAACHTDRADHAFHAIRDDGFIGDGKKNVLVYRDDALANVLLAAAVYKEDVDGHINLAAHAGKARAIAQAFHCQVMNGALRGGGAAAFKRDGRDGRGGGRNRFGAVTAATAATAASSIAGVGYHGVAGNGYFLVVQLLLLKAAVVHALNLHAHFFLQAIQSIAGDSAGTGAGVGVFVREKREGPFERARRARMGAGCA